MVMPDESDVIPITTNHVNNNGKKNCEKMVS